MSEKWCELSPIEILSFCYQRFGAKLPNMEMDLLLALIIKNTAKSVVGAFIKARIRILLIHNYYH